MYFLKNTNFPEVDQPDKLAQLAMRIKGLQQEPHRRQSVAHRRISAEKNSTCNVGDSSKCLLEYFVATQSSALGLS